MKKYIKKNSLILGLGLSLSLLLTACNNTQVTEEIKETEEIVEETEVQEESEVLQTTDKPSLGVAAALADDDLEMEEMITYALEDEYLARDEYIKIMEVFGEVKPFVNIAEAEKTHIELLLPLFEAYDIPLPEYETDSTPYSGTLQEAYKTDVQAEIDNIKMYERFLEEDLPDDVRLVFERLLSASQKHLKAFENKANN